MIQWMGDWSDITNELKEVWTGKAIFNSWI